MRNQNKINKKYFSLRNTRLYLNKKLTEQEKKKIRQWKAKARLSAYRRMFKRAPKRKSLLKEYRYTVDIQNPRNQKKIPVIVSKRKYPFTIARNGRLITYKHP